MSLQGPLTPTTSRSLPNGSHYACAPRAVLICSIALKVAAQVQGNVGVGEREGARRAFAPGPIPFVSFCIELEHAELCPVHQDAQAVSFATWFGGGILV